MDITYRKSKIYISVIVMSFAGAAIFVTPYIRFVFYDLQLTASGMNNTQSAFLMTAYALASMAVGIPGGILADKVSNKLIVMTALLGTAAVSILYSFTYKSYFISIVSWALFAITTGGLYWTVFSKILNVIGSKSSKDGASGSIFGIYYACNGVASTVISAVCLWISTIPSSPEISFRYVICVSALATAVSAVFVFIFLDSELIKPAEENKETEVKITENAPKSKSFSLILRNPLVWCFAILTIAGYTLNALTTYFNPYLISVIGVSPESSGFFAIIRNYIFLILSMAGGFLADKVFKSTAKWLGTAYFIAAAFILGLLIIPQGASPALVSIYTLIPAALMQMSYTINYSVINELGVPQNQIGTVTGFVSTLAVVDVVFTPLIGWLIDEKGNQAYTYMFIFLAITLAVGAVCSFIIFRSGRKTAS